MRQCFTTYTRVTTPTYYRPRTVAPVQRRRRPVYRTARRSSGRDESLTPVSVAAGGRASGQASGRASGQARWP